MRQWATAHEKEAVQESTALVHACSWLARWSNYNWNHFVRFGSARLSMFLVRNGQRQDGKRINGGSPSVSSTPALKKAAGWKCWTSRPQIATTGRSIMRRECEIVIMRVDFEIVASKTANSPVTQYAKLDDNFVTTGEALKGPWCSSK